MDADQWVAHNTDCKVTKTPEDLYSVGNKNAPKGGRPKDFGLSENSDIIQPSDAKFPPGASNANSIENLRVGGSVWKLPAGTDLPEGLAYSADGSDIEDGIMSSGHRTLYPTQPMTVGQFINLVQSLPWEWTGITK